MALDLYHYKNSWLFSYSCRWMISGQHSRYHLFWCWNLVFLKNILVDGRWVYLTTSSLRKFLYLMITGVSCYATSELFCMPLWMLNSTLRKSPFPIISPLYSLSHLCSTEYTVIFLMRLPIFFFNFSFLFQSWQPVLLPTLLKVLWVPLG